MTVPEAAAWIGVPYGTPMSMPSCIRPQRIPKGLVTGPDTGQIRPDAEGVPEPYEPEPADERCAAAPDAARPLARVGDLSLGRGDLGRDPLVLNGDRADVVELVDQIGEARRGEDDGERVRVARLVDRDETHAQPAERGPVLPPEE